MQSNWCLFTSYDDAFRRVASLAVPAMRQYASIHNMDFAEHVNYSCPRPASWGKIYLALEKFEMGYEYLFWVDADAVIRRFDEHIADLVKPEADIYFSKENVTPNTFRLNAGLWVMRNTPDTVRFLHAVRDQERFINHKWWEQAAIIEVLGLRSMFDLDEQGVDEPTSFMNKVAWLPRRWNAFAGKDHNPNPVVRHFVAMDPNGKEISMRMDALIDRIAPARNMETEAEFLEITKLMWKSYIRSVHVQVTASSPVSSKKEGEKKRTRVRRTIRNFIRFFRNRPMEIGK